MRLVTGNVRSLCSVGETKSAAGELEKHKLDLMGVQEVNRFGGNGRDIKQQITMHFSTEN
jgi:hypothetical protein